MTSTYGEIHARMTGPILPRRIGQWPIEAVSKRVARDVGAAMTNLRIAINGGLA